jgi:glycosyltransferase involved in cell wall biosynthesis
LSQPKRLLLDVTRLAVRRLQRRQPTGIDRVGVAYFSHLENRTQALLRLGPFWRVLSTNATSRFLTIVTNQATRPLALMLFLLRAWLVHSSGLRTSDVLIHTAHSGLENPQFLERLKKSKVQAVYFLHDLIPISHPEYNRPGEASRHHQRLKTMSYSASVVLVNSHQTKQAFESYLQQNQWPILPIEVAPLAAAKLPKTFNSRLLEAPYFVVLGTIEARKNHLLILQLWRDLVRRLGASAPHLVLIGRRGWESEQVLDLLDRCESIRHLVHEISHCPDDQMANWVKHAQALLFPSFVEGFGIPLVEALVLGTPVIASDLPVFKEIAGDVPTYLHPLDGLGWMKAIEEFSHMKSTMRENQIQRIRHFKAPTWREHFQVLDRALNSVSAPQ